MMNANSRPIIPRHTTLMSTSTRNASMRNTPFFKNTLYDTQYLFLAGVRRLHLRNTCDVHPHYQRPQQGPGQWLVPARCPLSPTPIPLSPCAHTHRLCPAFSLLLSTIASPTPSLHIYGQRLVP